MLQIRRGQAGGASRELFWRRMIRGQAESGLSIRSWCRRRRLAEPTFYWWRKELSRRDAAGRGPGGAGPGGGRMFVPVHVVEESPGAGAGAIEIVLSGQRRIRVTGRVDRQTLTDVLAIVTAWGGVGAAFGSEAPWGLSTQGRSRARREGRSC